MAALTSVDVGKELLSLLCADALECNPVEALTVQIAILHAVTLCLASYAFSFRIILGEDAFSK